VLANFLAISGAGAGFDSGGRLPVSAVACRAERGGAAGGDSGAANRLLARSSPEVKSSGGRGVNVRAKGGARAAVMLAAAGL